MLLQFLLSATALAAGEPTADFSYAHLWAEASIEAKLVIIILFVMFVACVVTAVERLLAFNRARKQSVRVVTEVVAPLQQGDLDRALEITSSEDFKASYLAGMLRAGIREMHQRTDGHGVANAHRAVEKAIGEELAKLKRGMTVLATTGATAPFVGLFGTTFGVIHSFEAMAQAGAGLGAISSQIAEALYTTAFGIGVAIVGVWLFNYFNLRMEKVTDELASSEADFLDWAHKLVVDRTEAAAKASK